MDDTQATLIRSLLLEAADAIDRANAIVAKLDGDDQALLSAALDEISSALHFELLQKLYLRYPGLAEEGAGWDERPGLTPERAGAQDAPAVTDLRPFQRLRF